MNGRAHFQLRMPLKNTVRSRRSRKGVWLRRMSRIIYLQFWLLNRPAGTRLNAKTDAFLVFLQPHHKAIDKNTATLGEALHPQHKFHPFQRPLLWLNVIVTALPVVFPYWTLFNAQIDEVVGAECRRGRLVRREVSRT